MRWSVRDGAKLVGQGELLIELPGVDGPAQGGELVDHDIGPSIEDRTLDRPLVEAVHDDGLGPGTGQGFQLGRGPRRAHHLVSSLDQHGHQAASHGTGGSGEKDPHDGYSFRHPVPR